MAVEAKSAAKKGRMTAAADRVKERRGGRGDTGGSTGKRRGSVDMGNMRNEGGDSDNGGTSVLLEYTAHTHTHTMA